MEVSYYIIPYLNLTNLVSLPSNSALHFYHILSLIATARHVAADPAKSALSARQVHTRGTTTFQSLAFQGCRPANVARSLLAKISSGNPERCMYDQDRNVSHHCIFLSSFSVQLMAI